MSEQMNEKDKGGRGRKNLIAFLIIMLMLMLAAGAYAFLEWLPNYEQAAYRDYHAELEEGALYFLIGGEYMTEYKLPLYLDGQIYLPQDIVAEYIDTRVFHEDGDIIITNTDAVSRMTAGDTAYTINNVPAALDTAPLVLNSTAYLPEDLIADLYGHVAIVYYAESGFVRLEFASDDRTEYAVSAKTAYLRYEPDKKSPYIEKLTAGERLWFHYAENGYLRVTMANGLTGWISEADAAPHSVTEGENIPAEAAITPLPAADNGRVIMLWDQVTTAEAAANPDRKLDYDGLDVISPTWFSFDAETLDGTIISIADRGYVERAHAAGLAVWALITDNFDREVCHAVLSDTATRKYVIDQLLELVDAYDLDGINIDYEMVPKDDAAYYIQFLRELAPLMHERGKTLSVDMYVPKEYNLYYNRTEVAKCADYIVIMGYDEHYSSSPVSGPVASIGFVEEGITETLKEAPKENIILGIPYFVRVWKETSGGEEITVSSSAYSMSRAYEMFTGRGAEFVWDEEIKSYYAEYTETVDGITAVYRVWLEDERSIDEKLALVEKYDLAGISGWKKGLETEDIWELLNDRLKD